MLRLAVAIVLAVLTLVCVLLARRALRRWKYPPKPRRRDFTPARIQQQRTILAHLRRMRRGLRFPTVRQKKEHERFKKWRGRGMG